MNEEHIGIVVNAALEDLVLVRQAHGAGSAEHQSQVLRSMAFIQGHLEVVLTAAQVEFRRRARDESRPATETARLFARPPLTKPA